MTRLQKKCLVAAAGAHFLALVVLLCSAFIPSHPPVDNSQVLDVIPSKLIDALANSGVKAAEPPPPAPPATQPPQPQSQPAPTPPPPKPEPQKQQPEKAPEPPKQAEPVKPPEPAEPDNAAAELKVTKPKPQPHRVDPNLTPVVRKNVKETDNHEAQAEAEAQAAAAAKEAKHQHERQVKALESAASSIRDNASSATTVELRGDSSVAYANYATIVKSVYTQRWILPDTTANDNSRVKVSVTIQRDGRVSDAHIMDRSGDSSVDRSVQRTLDRVSSLPPFPDEATDKERTYIIYFDLGAKRQMGG
jgi:TonB family protein